jgi:hypothetical protein
MPLKKNLEVKAPLKTAWRAGNYKENDCGGEF